MQPDCRREIQVELPVVYQPMDTSFFWSPRLPRVSALEHEGVRFGGAQTARSAGSYRPPTGGDRHTERTKNLSPCSALSYSLVSRQSVRLIWPTGVTLPLAVLLQLVALLGRERDQAVLVTEALKREEACASLRDRALLLLDQ